MDTRENNVVREDPPDQMPSVTEDNDLASSYEPTGLEEHLEAAEEVVEQAPSSKASSPWFVGDDHSEAFLEELSQFDDPGANQGGSSNHHLYEEESRGDSALAQLLYVIT